MSQSHKASSLLSPADAMTNIYTTVALYYLDNLKIHLDPKRRDLLQTMLMKQETLFRDFHTAARNGLDSSKESPQNLSPGAHNNRFSDAYITYKKAVGDFTTTYGLQKMTPPFDQFDQQIEKAFLPFMGDGTIDQALHVAEIFLPLQRLVSRSYAIEHDVRKGDILPENIIGNFHLEEYRGFLRKHPGLYKTYFGGVDSLVRRFPSAHSSNCELFESLKDPKWVQKVIDENITT